MCKYYIYNMYPFRGASTCIFSYLQAAEIYSYPTLKTGFDIKIYLTDQ